MTTMTSGTTKATPTEFADSLARLRRSIRRAVHMDLLEPGLPSTERELLMLVHRTSGIGIAEAADMLQVAPNTVSTMVSRLRRAGLLQRRPNPSDRRAAKLHLTKAGQTRIVEVRRRRTAILDRAFASLSAQDQEILLHALPAIDRLIVSLAALPPKFES